MEATRPDVVDGSTAVLLPVPKLEGSTTFKVHFWAAPCRIRFPLTPIGKSEPGSILRRGPPTQRPLPWSLPILMRRTVFFLSRSTENPCRHGSRSSYRSSEEPPCRIYPFR